jgi:hypothetical protein
MPTKSNSCQPEEYQLQRSDLAVPFVRSLQLSIGFGMINDKSSRLSTQDIREQQNPNLKEHALAGPVPNLASPLQATTYP